MKKKILSMVLTLLLVFNFTLPAYGQWLVDESIRIAQEAASSKGGQILIVSLVVIQEQAQKFSSYKEQLIRRNLNLDQKGIGESQIIVEPEFKMKLINEADDPLERPHRGPRGVPI